MIVTCPSCSARYKINESKIAGRGARITCPRCSHRFVVYRSGEDDGSGKSKRKVPDNVAQLDFSSLGITWRVRKGIGVTYDFYDLATLQDFLREGQVDKWDAISFDNRSWSAIETIEDLEAYFYDVWQRAMRGEISIAPGDDDGEEDEEDDSDAPTTIVGRGSSLASEIRQAITDAATPPPVGRVNVPENSEPHEPVPPPAYEEPGLAYSEPATEQEEAPSAEPEPAAFVETPSPAPLPQNEPQPAPLSGPPPVAVQPSAPAPSAPEPAPPPPRPAAQPASSGGTGLMVGVVALVLLVLLAIVALGGLYYAGLLGGGPEAASGAPPQAAAVLQPAQPDAGEAAEPAPAEDAGSEEEAGAAEGP